MVKEVIDLEALSEAERFIPSVYASRYAQEEIPKYEMPRKSMSARQAYQLIHDEIVLDGKPAQNLATFVTTWMEPEADALLAEGAHFNLADEDEYPHAVEIQNRCINIIAHLFHAEADAVGTSTIGSSEAMMLAGLAMKWRWRKHREAQSKPADKPNLVMGENVQVCWEKFTRYFDVEAKMIPIREGQYTIHPEDISKAVDENTIGVCAILGTTFTGEFEDIEGIADMLTEVNKKNNWDIPVHVDAASGGFVAPFLYPDLKWDFRNPLVRSINVSGHKFGLVYPGVGWVIWRDKASLPEELIFHVNYLGGDMGTFNLNFSRPASHVIAQYYNFIRLGHEGYANIMKNMNANATFIRNELDKMGIFTFLSKPNTLPLLAIALNDKVDFDVYQLSDKIRSCGWIVPAYSMPPNAENVHVLRVVVREGLSRDMAENLVKDMARAVKCLHEDGIESKLKKQKNVKVNKSC